MSALRALSLLKRNLPRSYLFRFIRGRTLDRERAMLRSDGGVEFGLQLRGADWCIQEDQPFEMRQRMVAQVVALDRGLAVFGIGPFDGGVARLQQNVVGHSSGFGRVQR